MSMFVDLDDLYLTDEHKMMRHMLRRFIDEQVKPVADDWEKQGRIPREIWSKMGKLGLLGMSFNESCGGSNLGPIGTLVFAEELGRSTYGGFAMSISAHTDMSASHIVRHGSDYLKSTYIPDVISGEKICAIAVTEPSGGSDVAGLKTSARPVGDEYIINGSKLFISNGVYADLYILAARTDPDAKGSRGISLFLIEKGMPGFTTSQPLDKTGCKCSDTAQLFLDNVKIPAANLIGEQNKGFYYIMEAFQLERISGVGNLIGVCEVAIDLTLRWLKDRKAFGKSLWDIQSIKLDMAGLVSELAAAKQLAYHTAWLDAQGMDAAMGACMSKAHIPELANRILYKCVQYHGGMGYMTETAVERMSRDTRIASIAGGATEVMLLEVAKRM